MSMIHRLKMKKKIVKRRRTIRNAKGGGGGGSPKTKKIRARHKLNKKISCIAREPEKRTIRHITQFVKNMPVVGSFVPSIPHNSTSNSYQMTSKRSFRHLILFFFLVTTKLRALLQAE